MPSENAFKNNRNIYKSLNFTEIFFKMPRILKNKPRGNCRIATMTSQPLPKHISDGQKS
jgi:hypothetical protein